MDNFFKFTILAFLVYFALLGLVGVMTLVRGDFDGDGDCDGDCNADCDRNRNACLSLHISQMTVVFGGMGRGA